MFPFWGSTCWGSQPVSGRDYQERRLRFLKWMRNDLEAKLAGLNAAIETIERQMDRENTTI
ncbi:hypothetical protein H6F78_20955 [Coleofasciculus sp. FACHB-64]|uniref:hypothetical protein n=1 Tax=Cyanophyceae TaxID=3028117 RepID=UPI0016839065|nr:MULTISPECIES: hypothetical protein [unclassified Coleofasciculus]MBD1836802.1 hypothetical protein [Coleofasciculus sp. FACHB-501]MBD2048032.1 hypothetical protein [Coleofasciculus sp. FACHB-64]